MGANTSSPEQAAGEAGETTFFANRDTPVQFSESLISHLSSNSLAQPTPGQPSLERQYTLDSHIQQRIQSELARLRQEEDQVRDQIEQALERENLDRERGTTDDKGVSHSVTLMQDLEHLESRQASARELSRSTKDAAPWALVEQNRAELEQCLSYVSSSTRPPCADPATGDTSRHR